MERSGWNIAVLSGIGLLVLCGTTQREKPVVGDRHAGAVADHEQAAAESPADPDKLRALAQAYLDARQPGMAVATLERAPAPARALASVEHLYARALVDQGRAGDALSAERRVLARCAPEAATGSSSTDVTCTSWLVAAATRRASLLEQLVQLGVEDAKANPEASSIAYMNATRQVSVR